ncbi:transposase IS66 family domain protein [Escherichia coli PA5]|nr:transposase IS66 family domain protein [Escherichia coli PA5]
MNNTLPDNIEQLKALLIAQQAVIVRLSEPPRFSWRVFYL